MKTWMPKEEKVKFLKSLAVAAAWNADDDFSGKEVPGGADFALKAAFILSAILQDYGVDYSEEMWRDCASIKDWRYEEFPR